MRTVITRSYAELSQLTDIRDRFDYLKLGGSVGQHTFGTERHLNQKFYRSTEWRRIRDHVLIRDNGCDLGIKGYEIHQAPHVHHMNPMLVMDLVDFNEDVLNPDYLITASQLTHNAIHYGDESLLPTPFVERRPGDTQLW